MKKIWTVILLLVFVCLMGFSGIVVARAATEEEDNSYEETPRYEDRDMPSEDQEDEWDLNDEDMPSDDEPAPSDKQQVPEPVELL